MIIIKQLIFFAYLDIFYIFPANENTKNINSYLDVDYLLPLKEYLDAEYV